ncbi:hypothetical protein BJ508DRAFT_346782 [Ascobolus immersus RN42]|uniref:BTB domain-containing protein n=1 Tax=Ascobolus immersus RN42 TaxID=1160509 RepID=A0A3N4I894_ASCIM|nr:hypothetical protein BJ508DRAFT_346782 [Ascobolus immersus RN42]
MLARQPVTAEELPLRHFPERMRVSLLRLKVLFESQSFPQLAIALTDNQDDLEATICMLEKAGLKARYPTDHNPMKTMLPKKRSFIESFGNHLITVILSPRTSKKPKLYQVHALKLSHASDYFAKLLQFPGVETTANEVRLDEGYEGMEEEFESFIDWAYTGNYHSSGCAVSEARMVVLSERLATTPLKTIALEKLELALKSQKALKIKAAAELIRTIYGGTHRPYSKDIPVVELAPSQPPSDKGIATPTIPSHDGLSKKLATSGYKNCKARAIVAQYIAGNLAKYRDFKVFREVLEEFGEFASDLVMQRIDLPQPSPLVVIK